MGVWVCVFFFKQKTAYEIVSRDWSSDVCSSDLMNLIEAMLVSADTQSLFFGTITSYSSMDRGHHAFAFTLQFQIGRASCRERV